MINGVRLKSIQLKETVFDGHVADKMERFHGPHCTNPIQFLRQVPWLRSVAKGRRKAWQRDIRAGYLAAAVAQSRSGWKLK